MPAMNFAQILGKVIQLGIYIIGADTDQNGKIDGDETSRLIIRSVPLLSGIVKVQLKGRLATEAGRSEFAERLIGLIDEFEQQG